MENLNYFIDQIPIRHNFASHLMLLGIVQGLFLTLVIFLKSKKDSAAMPLGWALLAQCIVFTDTYLCYTGIMKYMLYLNDSTEVLVLCVAPTLYFFIYSLLKRTRLSFKTIWPHFMLPVLYGISQIGYYRAPLPVKLNAYIGAYYEELGFYPIPESFDYSFMVVKDEFRWLILISFAFYSILGFRLAINAYKSKSLVGNKIKLDKYIFSLVTVVLFALLLIFLFLIFLNFDDDGGDHYVGIFHTLIIFTMSFFIISESRFFEKSWVADKYETLTTNSLHFESIEQLLADGERFLTKNLTLKSLSAELNTSPNLLSKVINSDTGLNFNDYINQKRVAEAKKRLLDNHYANLTVEAVGNSVGFTSKSAFYNAFKKHAGTTPSNFIKLNTT